MKKSLKTDMENGRFIRVRQNSFEKKDLENGMFIKTRDNSIGIVVNNTIVFQDGLYMSLGETTKDLICDVDSDLTIDGVYACKCFNNVKSENYDIIWERDVYLLDEEEKKYIIEHLEPFNYKVDYICKDYVFEVSVLVFYIGNAKYTIPLKHRTDFSHLIERHKYTLKELGIKKGE